MTRMASVVLGLALILSGCVKPDTFDPYANPGRSESDRLQRIVNGRPDLETVERQLADLDALIRTAIAKHSPRSVFSTVPATHLANGCQQPFTRSIGRQINSDMIFVQPAPSLAQWSQIVAELAPLFATAGLSTDNSGSANFSQRRDDGVTIKLVNGQDGSPLDYSYDTGCHLPAGWRTAAPPPGWRPANDPNVHYPFLFEPPGGRSVDAY